MLRTRILTAVIGIPILIIFLIADPIYLMGLSAVAAVIGLIEYYKACGLIKKKGLCFIACTAGIILMFGTMFNAKIYMAIIFFTMIILFAETLFNHSRVGVEDVSRVVFSLIYIPFFLSNINYIRTLEPYGEYYIWLMFLGAFITDSCAYFTGKAIGKHKLCPSISPKKTVEGAIGGVIGTGIVFIGFAYIVNVLFHIEFEYIKIFILGLIVAIVSEIGDLAASIIKRNYDIKDFGNILPGHGGILDRCDSIILVAPVMYLYLIFIGL